MRKKVYSAVLAVGLILAFAASASALDYDQAWNLSWSQNHYECNNAGSLFYYCASPVAFGAIYCHLTGVNVSGKAEWGCTSSFTQSPLYPGAPHIGLPRLCHEQDGWGPYGGHIFTYLGCATIGGIGVVRGPGILK